MVVMVARSATPRRIACVRDELLAHFRRSQARRQAGGPELRVGLTLAIDNDCESDNRLGDGLPRLPTRAEKHIEAGEPTGQLVGAFADGDPAPSEVAFRTALPAGPSSCTVRAINQPTDTSLQGLDRSMKAT